MQLIFKFLRLLYVSIQKREGDDIIYRLERNRRVKLDVWNSPNDFVHLKIYTVFLRIKRETDLQMYKCIRKVYCVRALPLRIFKRSSPSNPTTLPNAELKKMKERKKSIKKKSYLCSRDEMMIGMIYWLHS